MTRFQSPRWGRSGGTVAGTGWRVGADIGMRCAKCDRKAMLARPEFERRVKRMVSRTQEAEDVQTVENESAV